MSKERTFSYLYLILLNGERIEIYYPDDIEEEFFEELPMSMNTNKCFYVGNWDCVQVNYMNNHMDFINFNQVVGYY